MTRGNIITTYSLNEQGCPLCSISLRRKLNQTNGLNCVDMSTLCGGLYENVYTATVWNYITFHALFNFKILWTVQYLSDYDRYRDDVSFHIDTNTWYQVNI